jgi:hypothetical protein
MDAVIYLRVSTKEQASNDEAGEGYSIPAQREACLRHIAERGWNLAGEFTDAGESARTADRPMLKRSFAGWPRAASGLSLSTRSIGWPAPWRTMWPSERRSATPGCSWSR